MELRLILDCGRSANPRRQTNIIEIDAEDHELSVLRGMRRQFLIFRLRSIFPNLGEKVWSAFKCWQAWPGTASSTTQLTVGEAWYWTIGLKKWNLGCARIKRGWKCRGLLEDLRAKKVVDRELVPLKYNRASM